MVLLRNQKWIAAILLASIVGACGGPIVGPRDREGSPNQGGVFQEEGDGTSIFDIFRRDRFENEVSVNRYIWSASLEVLDFLPIQSVDPFTGLIVTGYGTPPNGGRAYRATVLIRDPSLEARSLNVALQTRSGPASAATVRAVEDAILTRARQLRSRDGRL